MIGIMTIRFSYVKANPSFPGEDELEAEAMTIYRLWAGCFGQGNRCDAGARPQAPRADTALRLLVDRGDERLLRDAGLTRDEVLDPVGGYWSDWARRPRHPML
jgi:hypothetical protein